MSKETTTSTIDVRERRGPWRHCCCCAVLLETVVRKKARKEEKKSRENLNADRVTRAALGEYENRFAGSIATSSLWNLPYQSASISIHFSPSSLITSHRAGLHMEFSQSENKDICSTQQSKLECGNGRKIAFLGRQKKVSFFCVFHVLWVYFTSLFVLLTSNISWTLRYQLNEIKILQKLPTENEKL